MKEPAPIIEESPLFTLTPGFKPRSWLIRHLHAVIFTLGRLVRSPVNGLITGAVIGMALALPAGLYVLLDNVKVVTRHWDSGAQVSLYLSSDLDDNEASMMADRLLERTDIERVEVITKAQALEEYQRLTGLSELVIGDDNPLPPVLVVFPSPTHSELTAVGRLVEELTEEPGVDIVQSDLAWLERLNAIVQILHRGVWILVVLFSLGVLLVVGNTIRLGIQNQHQEIEISKLVGATDAFIRRPFLYSGLWYGLLGGLLAWVLLDLTFRLLQTPVDELSALYYSRFELHRPGTELIAILLLGGGLLGLFGSWVALARYLSSIEPS